MSADVVCRRSWICWLHRKSCGIVQRRNWSLDSCATHWTPLERSTEPFPPTRYSTGCSPPSASASDAHTRIDPCSLGKDMMHRMTDIIRTGSIDVRVRYAECDPMGVVHHTVYPVWFEMGRTELLRETGASYREFEEAVRSSLSSICPSSTSCPLATTTCCD